MLLQNFGVVGLIIIIRNWDSLPYVYWQQAYGIMIYVIKNNCSCKKIVVLNALTNNLFTSKVRDFLWVKRVMNPGIVLNIFQLSRAF